jgi:hypothetical protein
MNLGLILNIRNLNELKKTRVKMNYIVGLNIRNLNEL